MPEIPHRRARLIQRKEAPVAAILFGALALTLVYWLPMRRWFGALGRHGD